MDLQVACWQHVTVCGGRSQPADIFPSGQGKQGLAFARVQLRHVTHPGTTLNKLFLVVLCSDSLEKPYRFKYGCFCYSTRS